MQSFSFRLIPPAILRGGTLDLPNVEDPDDAGLDRFQQLVIPAWF